MTEAPPTDAPARSYWQQVGVGLRRNRIAMLAAAMLVLVALVAVFCPLIANNRPLYLRAVLEADYFNSLQIVIEQTSFLTPEIPAETRANARTLALANFEEVRTHLQPREAGDLALIRDDLLRQLDAGGTLSAEASAALAARLDPFFEVTLTPVPRYPAIRALTAPEVYALLAFAAMIPAMLIRGRRVGFAARLLAALAIAGICTAMWKSAWPTIQDNRPYRAIVEAQDFPASGGAVVRTPVSYGENENIIRESRQPPTWRIPAAQRAADAHWHWLGTDTNGRDVLARMIYGARVSMLVGVIAVSVYTAIGIVLGALAGFYGGWTDIAISRVIEVVICFPPLMLILAVQAFLAPSIFNIILTLAALWWTGVARLQRAEFLRLVGMDFVQSVRALGGSSLRIIFLHILPNGLGPILVMTSFGIAGSILIESGLSFLGFGVPQPMASWGDLLNNGRNDIKGTWWLTVFPGLAIFATVTCFNLLGEAVRDALDPRRGK